MFQAMETVTSDVSRGRTIKPPKAVFVELGVYKSLYGDPASAGLTAALLNETWVGIKWICFMYCA